MDARGRGRKPTDAHEPKDASESIPPPRMRREKHELDPDTLWDTEGSDANADEEGGEDSDAQGEDGDDWDNDGEEETVSDLDDWDHPLRGLKIN